MKIEKPRVDEERRYLIRDTTARGELVLWWGPDRCGYTTVLDKAGLYTKTEAEAIEKIRGTDKAVALDEIETLIVRVVRYDDFPLNFSDK